MQTILWLRGAIGTPLAKDSDILPTKSACKPKSKKSYDTDELFSADITDADQLDKAMQVPKSLSYCRVCL